MFDYLIRCFQRACTDTRNDLRLSDGRTVLKKIVVTFIVIFLLYGLEFYSLFLTSVDNFTLTIFAIFVAAIIYFAVNLLLSPYRIDKDRELEITSLKALLTTRARRQKNINKLWCLRSVGISLRNRPVLSKPDYDQWILERRTWRNNVLLAAGEVSQNLKNWIERLDRVGSPPDLGFAPYPNSEHRSNIRNMSEELLRLQKYLERELYIEPPTDDVSEVA